MLLLRNKKGMNDTLISGGLIKYKAAKVYPFCFYFIERCPVLTAVKDLSDLDNDCGREPNEDCGFNCIKNYKPAINSLTIKCLPGNAPGVARWNVTTATLCEGLH